MYELSDFRKNLKVMVEGQPYVVVDFQHVKPGKGNQFTRAKLRNIITGSNLDRTFKQGERFEVPDVLTQDAQFLYKDDAGFHFMIKSNYETVDLNADDVGESSNYLIENLEVTLQYYNGRVFGVDVPNAVNIPVDKCDPGIKGDRVSGATKGATLVTGYFLQVPLHINEGDVLRVDTRTGLYVERVSK